MASNKDVLRRFIEESWNQHKPETARNYCAPNCEFKLSGWEPAHGVGEVESWMREQFQAFPDMKCEIKAMVEEGPHVGVWLYVSGTHRGPLRTPEQPVPPTNRPMSFDLIEMIQFDKGKLARVTGTYDVLHVWRQLGVEPSRYMPSEAHPSP